MSTQARVYDMMAYCDCNWMEDINIGNKLWQIPAWLIETRQQARTLVAFPELYNTSSHWYWDLTRKAVYAYLDGNMFPCRNMYRYSRQYVYKNSRVCANICYLARDRCIFITSSKKWCSPAYILIFSLFLHNSSKPSTFTPWSYWVQPLSKS